MAQRHLSSVLTVSLCVQWPATPLKPLAGKVYDIDHGYSTVLWWRSCFSQSKTTSWHRAPVALYLGNFYSRWTPEAICHIPQVPEQWRHTLSCWGPSVFNSQWFSCWHAFKWSILITMIGDLYMYRLSLSHRGWTLMVLTRESCSVASHRGAV